MWFRRNVLQDCEGGLRSRTMYLETVDWATSNPSISNSPWIRGAPQSGFSLLIRRMRSRSSRSTFGRPALFRDFRRQNALKPERCLPSQDSFRLHDPGYVEQTRPNPRHPCQQRPITAVQPQPRRRSPQCDVKLMTKKQVLGFQPASRLENVDNEGPQHVQDRKHRPG